MPLVQEKSEADLKCAFVYGVTGAGKTRLCASWPRVAWIGAARELGWLTIQNMPPTEFYEHGRIPRIYKVSTMQELGNDLIHDIFPRVQTGDVKTICLEISVYADDVIRSMKGVSEKNGWAKYQALEEHIVAIDERVKSIPGLRVVYNSLAAPAVDEKHPSGLQRSEERRVGKECRYR